MIGLIKAVSSFDYAKGRFSTYAARCIENEILMAMRAYKKRQNDLSLYDEIGTDNDGNQLKIIDMLSIDEETMYKKTENDITRQGIVKLIDKHLNEREKQLIDIRYGLTDGEGKTQQETADILGISRSYVSRLEKAAIEKLKRHMM